MPKNTNIRELAGRLKCCAIVPTYNNANTLQAVIDDVFEYFENVIVVDDGATDSTSVILALNPSVITIFYNPNKGKGYAIKKGFDKALSLGFRYALTIDSDGQHSGRDIYKFLDKIQQYPDSLIVGSRLLRQLNMPGGNTFANKFSNFWYRLQTGINLPDTQSGFRLYPLYEMGRMHLFTNRYETELEILVRAAWMGINVCDVAISVYYPPREERISHFRPFRDFFRISILNTFLTIIALFGIYPAKWIKKLLKFSKK
jgi:glycosyltransferase involved in cell wall biosynthesis